MVPSTFTRRAIWGAHGEVVDGREVPHLAHVVEARALVGAQPEAGHGDVALDEPDAAHRVRVGDLELLDPGAGQHRVLGLHEADGLGVGALGEQPGEQGGSEETGKAGHEQLCHAIILLCTVSRTGTGGGPGAVTGWTCYAL